MKILMTGFDPFGGDTVNPAFEAVRLLPDSIGGAEILKQEIPTVFGKAGEILENCIRSYHPDVVICVGQAGGRPQITPEKVAINLREASIPDNEGNQPRDLPVKEDGDTAYFATLPVNAMTEAIRAAGLPAAVSYTAGTFVCNDLMYTLLYLIDRKYPEIRGGFIHVPFAREQVADRPSGTPCLELSEIARGLEAAVMAILENRGKSTASEGTIQ